MVRTSAARGGGQEGAGRAHGWRKMQMHASLRASGTYAARAALVTGARARHQCARILADAVRLKVVAKLGLVERVGGNERRGLHCVDQRALLEGTTLRRAGSRLVRRRRVATARAEIAGLIRRGAAPGLAVRLRGRAGVFGFDVGARERRCALLAP